MNPKEEAKRISDTRRVTSYVLVFDDDVSEAIDVVICRMSDGHTAEVIKTMSITSYEDLDEFSGSLIRQWT